MCGQNTRLQHAFWLSSFQSAEQSDQFRFFHVWFYAKLQIFFLNECLFIIQLLIKSLIKFKKKFKNIEDKFLKTFFLEIQTLVFIKAIRKNVNPTDALDKSLMVLIFIISCSHSTRFFLLTTDK